MSEPVLMQQLLDHLITEAPEENKGSISVQITFKTNQITAGQVTRGPVSGIYKLVTVGNKGNEQIMVAIYFTADTILHLSQPMSEASKLVTPPGAGKILKPV